MKKILWYENCDLFCQNIFFESHQCLVKINPDDFKKLKVSKILEIRQIFLLAWKIWGIRNMLIGKNVKVWFIKTRYLLSGIKIYILNYQTISYLKQVVSKKDVTKKNIKNVFMFFISILDFWNCFEKSDFIMHTRSSWESSP